MWVEKTKTGLRLCDRYKGLDGKFHRVVVPLDRDTAQARRKAQIELQNKITAKCANISEMPFSGLVELYINHKDIKPSTLINYISAFSQISDILGDIIASRLTAPYVLRRLSESNKPPTTLNRYISLLNGLLTWAYDFGYIAEKIHVRSFPEKEQKRDPSQEYLETDELRSVLDQLQGTMAYYVCKFLALTGCRIGEASALTLNDIDDRYVYINKAYKVQNGISTPKTIHSVRNIYIQPELQALLKEYKEWRLLYMMAYGIRSDLLFFSARGSYYTAQHFARSLYKVNCPKHLHPHIFRHTHTALLAEQGMSLEAIARRLGHSSSQITKDIYFHITEKLKERDEMMMSKISIL